MNYLRTSVFALCLLSLTTGARSEEIARIPTGWNEQVIDEVREVGNGNASVRISPWQSLSGKSIEQWLTGFVNNDPHGGVLLSTDAVKNDSITGSSSVNRKAKFDGQEGVALLYACPGQPGHARLISMDIKDGGIADMFKATLYGENVCKLEPKGAGTRTEVVPGKHASRDESESASKLQKSTDHSADLEGADSDNGFLKETGPAPDNSLISQMDATATINAVAGGLNPNLEVIPSNFICYDKSSINTNEPIGKFVVDGSSITVIVGDKRANNAPISRGDREGQVYIGDGSSPLLKLNIEFNKYGQILSGTKRRSQNRLNGCYQDGAALEAIKHQVVLNTPEAGEYSCVTAESNKQSAIQLIDGGRYRAQGETGTYQYGEVFSSGSSEIRFTTGPLQSAQADYSEDPKSGLQQLVFKKTNSRVFLDGTATASLTVRARCARQSVPKPYKQYGTLKAPKPVAPKRALKGMYFVDSSRLTAYERSELAGYMDFKTNGYLYTDTPEPGGTDCNLTLPNGLPLCKQYDFDGTTLSISTPWGETEKANVRLNDDRTLRSIGALQVEFITPVDPASVVGIWNSQEVRSSGPSACLVGMCNSSTVDRQYVFQEDGRYQSTRGAKYNRSSNNGVSTAHGNSRNSNEWAGTYRVNGNTVELKSREGEVTELLIYLTKKGKLIIGDAQYSQ